MVKFILMGVFLTAAQTAYADAIYCPDINLNSLSNDPSFSYALRTGQIPSVYLDAEKQKKPKQNNASKAKHGMKHNDKHVGHDYEDDVPFNEQEKLDHNEKSKALVEFCNDLSGSSTPLIQATPQTYRPGDPL